jgi:hypothetical protein
MLTLVRRYPWTTVSVVLVVACVLCVAYLIAFVYPHLPLINPDSAGYLNFAWHRSIGYPLFLAAIYRATGNLFVVVPIQAALVVSSVVFFFYQVGRCFDKLPLALITAAAFILNAPVIKYAYSIFTESVFMTLVLFAGGALFWALRRAHRGPILMCAVAAASAVAVKAVGIVLLVFPLILLVQCHDRRRMVVAYGLLPWLAVFLAFAAYNAVTLGNPSPFLRGGMSLFAGTAHLQERGSTTADYAPIVDELATKTAGYRHLQDTPPSHRERRIIKKAQHAEVAYSRGEFKGLKRRLDQLVAANPAAYCSGTVRTSSSRYFGRPHPKLCRDRLQRDIAIHAIETDPIGYAAYVLDNAYEYFRASFHQGKLNQESFDRRRDDALKIASDIYLNAPPEHFAEGEPADPVPMIAAIHVMRMLPYELLGLSLGIITFATALLTLLAVPAAIAKRRRLSRLAAGAGALSLALAGAYTMMSLTHHVIARYVQPFQPVLLVAGVLGCVLVTRIAAHRLHRGSWSWAPLFAVNPSDSISAMSGEGL